jgi:hypothetical protein
VDVDSDEVECMIANMIFRVGLLFNLGCPGKDNPLTKTQGFMKGYISHEKQMVVLAKTNPFPSMSSILR